MSTLTSARRAVKPNRPPASREPRPFADGLIDPGTGRLVRRMPYSASDLAWAETELNQSARDFDVVAPVPPPIRGGAPEAEPATPADLPPALLWDDWTDADRWELGPEPIAGGAPDDADENAEWDRLAALSAALDRMERGLDGSDPGRPSTRHDA